MANSVAAVVGAIVGLLCRGQIDRGDSMRVLHLVIAGLLVGVGLRAAASWNMQLAPLANTFGAATAGVYAPLLMSIVYERVKRTGVAYHFHLCAEAGLDVGMILGCLAVAVLIWAGAAPSLAVLPAGLGIIAPFWCLRAGRMLGTGVPSVRGDAAAPRARRAGSLGALAEAV